MTEFFYLNDNYFDINLNLLSRNFYTEDLFPELLDFHSTVVEFSVLGETPKSTTLYQRLQERERKRETERMTTSHYWNLLISFVP